MKMKTLATALTVSLPLMFGTAFAQTTTAPESGNNRSSDGGARTTNPYLSGSGTGSTLGGNAGNAETAEGGRTAGDANAAAGNTAASGNTAAGSGAAGNAAAGNTAAPGTGATAGGAAAATDRAMPDANASGMETRDSAATSTEAITGWSAKDDLMGKSVVNENDDKIGDIQDVVISSDGRTLYLLVGAGGFLGMGTKDVAVPFDRFERRDDDILLSGYTKEQLKALPEVRTTR